MDTNPTAQVPTDSNQSENTSTPLATSQNLISVNSNPVVKKSRFSKKWIFIILGVILLLAIGGAGEFFLNQQMSNSPTTPSNIPTPTTSANVDENQVACTMEAKLCPDGVTYVSRQGPKCEFTPCPTSSSNTDEDKNWQSYTNSKYGFSFKYPTDWKTSKLYSPESLSYTHLNLGLVPAKKVKTGYEYVFEVEHYDNPNNLSFQEWDKKENEGKNMPRNLYSPETKSENIAGFKAYVNEKGHCDPVMCKEVIIMHDDNILVFRNLDFTNMDYTKEETESYKPIFEQILSTLKFN